MALVIGACLLASPALACLPVGRTEMLDSAGYAGLAKLFLAQAATVDVVTPIAAKPVFDREARKRQLREVPETASNAALRREYQSHLSDPVGYRISLQTVERIKGRSPPTTTLLGEQFLETPPPEGLPEPSDFTVWYSDDGKLQQLEFDAEQEFSTATFLRRAPCWRPLTFTKGERYLVFRDTQGHLLNAEGLPQPLRKVDLSSRIGQHWYAAIKSAADTNRSGEPR